MGLMWCASTTPPSSETTFTRSRRAGRKLASEAVSVRPQPTPRVWPWASRWDSQEPSATPSVAQVTVPECEDETITTVRSRLDALGLTIREEDQSSDEIDEGRVIRCEPASGTEVDEDSEVLVYVSLGAEAVEVPRVSGQTQAEATETLRDAGLGVGDITQEDHPDVPAGSVIRTNPAAGVEVERGEQIDLVISRGPSPSPTPSPTPVSTPVPTPVPTPTPTLPPTPEPSA